MSATNRGGQRSEADFYRTPAWPIERLLEACDLPNGGNWIELGAGEGDIIRAVEEDFRRMTVRELEAATRNGVKERTIRKMESKEPQATAEDVTIRALAKALSDREHQIVCHPEFLARWRKPDGTFDAFNIPDPTLGASRAPAAVEPTAEEKKVEPKANRTDLEPKRRKLTENAEIERAIGRHRDTVTLPSGTYPLVGLDWMQEIEGRYAEFLGQPFAISGLVTDQRPIPAKAAVRLDAELGRGAGCFKVERTVAGIDEDGNEVSVPVFPTVFAPKGDHGKRLMSLHRDRVPVTVLVHLTVSERNGLKGEDRWEGYISFEAGKPKPRSWAFVVDEVIAGEGAGAAVKRKPGKRSPVFAPGGVAVG